MAIVQFRIHPGVGCARMGNSGKAYHLASEFPYFLQEEFPNLRFKPKPRTHPKKFFPNNTDPEATGTLGTYNIYDTTPEFQNAFKENDPEKGVIFPQGVRFRVFAYVYDDAPDLYRAQKVFEVTADMANITWKVDIANKKSQKSTATVPDENATSTTFDLVTSVPPPPVPLLCKRIRPRAGLPNLGYIFLERDDADKNKVTGRLHVIGNEGDIINTGGASLSGSLWSDDWYDSAGDGPVQAIISPKGDAVRIKAGVANVADLKYFDYGTDAPQPGTTANINALPAWVVVGPPDYVPDMGHFVSLWDIALDRAFLSIEKGTVVDQPGKHKLIRSQAGTYKNLDYLIHIHPQLCLFDDVKFVSGEAFGEPELPTPVKVHPRAHNKHPGNPPPAPDPDNLKAEKAAIAHGNIKIEARANKVDLAHPDRLKDPNSKLPIDKWLKRAIFSRLRKPETLYDTLRKFIIVRPGEDPALGGSHQDHTLPRKLGRRMDYDRASGGDKNQMYEFPNYEPHLGSLLNFHGLSHAGKRCGGPKYNAPPGKALTPDELLLLKWMDDMYWPATFSDMPMLRELAYPPFQYKQFEAWKTKGAIKDIAITDILVNMLDSAIRTSFNTPGSDADKYFADFLAAAPSYAPAIIDMAALGAMIGGSFLPGIEVGREAAIAGNWCLFHGPNEHFPTIRFKPVGTPGEHTHGTLTKDLAVPWSEDFKDCDEKFWPTARPGRTVKPGMGTTRHNWLIEVTDSIPHLGRTASSAEEFVKEYWKALGFIRRNAADEFLEQEQNWH